MAVTLIRGVNQANPGDNELFARWQDKLANAKERTHARSDRRGALIEVAAQHPLRDGLYPNAEFAARLDSAIALYRRVSEEEPGDVRIYVPGSVHMDNGIPDKISLSKAGCNYLMEHGIEAGVLFGDDANEEFKGDAGVYNSSDECFVACKLFEKLGYGKLHCVCSPAQLLRKALSYITFGYVPLMHSVPCEDMFHSYVDEAFLYIPRLLEDNNGLQSDSWEADRLRSLRKPGFKHE
jgi:hypothetical protein